MATWFVRARSRSDLALRVVALVAGMAAFSAHALETRVVTSGLDQPLFLTAPAGDSRLFVVQKTGSIRIIQNGALLPTPFLTIPSVNTDGERGLLGLAFDPNYASNGKFYVDYIDSTSPFNTKIASYTTPSSTPNVANPTGTPILTITQPDASTSNHKAGWIGFRPGDPNDLYIATGDGGGSDDTFGNGQNKTSLLAKILRIDVHNVPAGGTYGIPAGNLSARVSGVAPEVWAYGLRNPYRNSFDRQTGDFYIADVGQDTREEIDFEQANRVGNENYGWPLREGKGANPNPAKGDPQPADGVDPIYDYSHGTGPLQGEAVISGYVYRGSLIAGLQGTYIFGDYISGRIFTLRVDPATGKVIGNSIQDITDALGNPVGPQALTSFGEDALGELYLVDISRGRILALVPEPSSFALIGVGLVSLLWLARRRSRFYPNSSAAGLHG